MKPERRHPVGDGGVCFAVFRNLKSEALPEIPARYPYCGKNKLDLEEKLSVRDWRVGVRNESFTRGDIFSKFARTVTGLR